MKIPDNVVEQVKTMHAEGKKNKEIKAFVFKEYNIELPNFKLYSIFKDKVSKKAAKTTSETPPENPIQICQGIRGLVNQLEATYLETLHNIRLHLIKAVARVRTQDTEK